MRPILLLDVYALFFRAYHALPPLATAAGVPTSGLYGFSSLLLKVWREESPKGATFAIDPPGPTFRHEQYVEYKANRPKELPGTLGAQLGMLPTLLDAFGFPRISARGFEADDVLATLARTLAESGESPLVVTGDHDALQLADAPTRVLIVSRGKVKEVRYDADAVRAKLGVGPALVPDWKALVGDPSDNLPGVPGIGPSTAAALLEKHGGLDGVLAHLEELPPKARRLIGEHADQLREWQHLATLVRDVPLPAPPHHTPLDGPARDRLRALFTELEMTSLVKRLDTLEE